LRFRLAPLVDTARLVAQGGPVLDLGCGQGMFTHVLRAFDADRQIVGIDTDQRRIHVARAVATDDRLSFRVGDARSFDLANATHVTLIDLLHHMPFAAQEELLHSLTSQMRPGTVLLVKDLHRRPLWKYTWHYLQDSMSYRFSGLWFRAREDMLQLLNACKLEVQVIDLGRGYPHPHIAYLCRKPPQGV
jgi:2-polyprenyl-3-methyl-5-hydroxy-6-metoxy-1,4-benzoquinol methylase